MATVKDVAREAGVSLGTVSNVLNEKDGVKPENREKVYKAMKKLGFHKGSAVSSRKTRATMNIGLIVPTIENPFYGEMISESRIGMMTMGGKNKQKPFG